MTPRLIYTPRRLFSTGRATSNASSTNQHTRAERMASHAAVDFAILGGITALAATFAGGYIPLHSAHTSRRVASRVRPRHSRRRSLFPLRARD